MKKLALLSVLFASVFTQAEELHLFEQGEVLTAKSLNDNFSLLFDSINGGDGGDGDIQVIKKGKCELVGETDSSNNVLSIKTKYHRDTTGKIWEVSYLYPSSKSHSLYSYLSSSTRDNPYAWRYEIQDDENNNTYYGFTDTSPSVTNYDSSWTIRISQPILLLNDREYTQLPSNSFTMVPTDRDELDRLLQYYEEQAFNCSNLTDNF
ncbi:hypothetical protein EDB29_1011094 [Vibrio crassostreae]|uniref:hypothetical protein n=1 Tax=Vibrio crassostreae TaxID=246167 RepID=UPI00104D9951|nr:hypothetical protein [Vibrio crassostreae]CAH6851591.1 exported hypothetical protein [Vibrio chagasii]TCT44282.1 hypothetical protein EDB29_1011094 [Vibrio crassostreae]CAH6863209.1 exported hypothetical protein [Vibrio chagasii]CAH6929209.1 exported hypothetical protein [Vibrio chagasii]CAH6948716.1 exported hypothetical protein [Vibrio chagasii]